MKSQPINELIPARQVDVARRAEILAKPTPKKQFVIYFVARSGSTRISEILSLTRNLGYGTELFNPNFMPKISDSFQAQSLSEFIEHGRKQHQTRGVFSFQITANHLQAVFEEPKVFFDSFGQVPSYWLTRDNIVEQAVSLAKMVRTSVGHSSIWSAEQIKKSDASFTYDRKEIRHWLRHLALSELLMERFFSTYEVTPQRITYEQMSQKTAAEIADMFAQDILGRQVELPETTLTNRKIGTSRNTEFAERYAEQDRDYLKVVETVRTRMRSAPVGEADFREMSMLLRTGMKLPSSAAGFRRVFERLGQLVRN